MSTFSFFCREIEWNEGAVICFHYLELCYNVHWFHDRSVKVLSYSGSS